MIEREEEETPVFEKYNKLLHGRRKPGKKMELVSLPFVKKFFEYAKAMCSPVLTEKASEMIAQAYADLRSHEDKNDRTLPVTARSLETLIRLSTAHAKLHLAKNVDEGDVKVALELMKFALHHDVGGDESASDSEMDFDDEDDKRPARARKEEALVPKAPPKSPKSPRSPRSPRAAQAAARSSSEKKESDPFAIDAASPVRSLRIAPRDASAATSPSERLDTKKRPIQSRPAVSPAKKLKTTDGETHQTPVQISPDRVQWLQKTLVSAMSSRRSEELAVTELEDELNKTGSSRFSRAEINAALSQLEDENKLMVREGVIHRI